MRRHDKSAMSPEISLALLLRPNGQVPSSPPLSLPLSSSSFESWKSFFIDIPAPLLSRWETEEICLRTSPLESHAYLGERVDWACKRDSPVFWSSETFVFVPNENKRDERIRKYRISLENGIEVSRRKLLSSNRYWSKELGGKKALPSTSVRNNWTSCSPQL